MELKDYFRVIRRRLRWFVGLMLVIVGGYAVSANLSAHQVFFAQIDLIAANTATSSLFDGIILYFPNATKMTPDTRVESLKRKEIQDLAALYLCEARESPEGPYLFAKERETADKAAADFEEALFAMHEDAHPGMDPEALKASFQAKAEEVVRAQRRLDPATGRWEGTMGKWQEFLVKAIAASISGHYTVDKSEKLQIVTIVAKSDTAHKAVAIANALGDAAIRFNQELDYRELTKAMVTARKRIADNEARLAETRGELKDFWKRHNISENEFYTSAHFYHQIENLQGDIERLRDQLAKKGEEEVKLAEQRKLDAEQFPEFMIPKDSLLNQLLTERTVQEQEVEHLLSKYTETHPEVRKARREIEELKQRFDLALVRFKEHDARNHKRDLALLNLERSYIRAEIERKTKALEALDARRVSVDQLKMDERRVTNLIDHLEEANKRLANFVTSAELFADTAARPIDRLQSAPLDPERDWWAEESDPFQLIWFVFVIALLISLGAVFMLEYMDTTIRTEEDIRRHLNLPLLGVIPRQMGEEGVILSDLPTKSVFAEQFYTAATVFRSTAKELGLKTVLVASTVPQEGKTTITVNLGIALARKGYKVLIVDSDLRIPQVHEVMGLENTFGLSSVLEGRLKAKEMLSEIMGTGTAPTLESCMLKTSEENLRIIPSGPCPADPMALMEGTRMKALMEELKAYADFVLFDTPPLTSVSDALPLAEMADAVVFVVSAGAAERHQITRAKHLLSSVEANVLGCVLNYVTIDGQSYYYYYNSYKAYRSRS